MASPAVPPPITTTLWFRAAELTGDAVAKKFLGAAITERLAVAALQAAKIVRLRNILIAIAAGETMTSFYDRELFYWILGG